VFIYIGALIYNDVTFIYSAKACGSKTYPSILEYQKTAADQHLTDNLIMPYRSEKILQPHSLLLFVHNHEDPVLIRTKVTIFGGGLKMNNSIVTPENVLETISRTGLAD